MRTGRDRGKTLFDQKLTAKERRQRVRAVKGRPCEGRPAFIDLAPRTELSLARLGQMLGFADKDVWQDPASKASGFIRMQKAIHLFQDQHRANEASEREPTVEHARSVTVIGEECRRRARIGAVVRANDDQLSELPGQVAQRSGPTHSLCVNPRKMPVPHTYAQLPVLRCIYKEEKTGGWEVERQAGWRVVGAERGNGAVGGNGATVRKREQRKGQEGDDGGRAAHGIARTGSPAGSVQDMAGI
ncbi:hypothetical protein K488DRAFT_75070 [Vararia minispora EC-137]|uniref:Uncharacterized protein n=1 Tax=Vararia minispora EC-137 TaxID=1314806 RepID=A0ACB8Q5B8_9AGAM|nr:hypothetical protein K488DRAFT_75070 [Vararia minispora EC-137]